MQDKASIGGHEPQSKVSGFRVLGHLPAASTRDLNSSNWPSCRCVTSYKKKKGLINFWRIYFWRSLSGQDCLPIIHSMINCCPIARPFHWPIGLCRRGAIPIWVLAGPIPLVAAHLLNTEFCSPSKLLLCFLCSSINLTTISWSTIRESQRNFLIRAFPSTPL